MSSVTSALRECHRLRVHIRNLQAEIDRGPRVLQEAQDELEDRSPGASSPPQRHQTTEVEATRRRRHIEANRITAREARRSTHGDRRTEGIRREAIGD